MILEGLSFFFCDLIFFVCYNVFNNGVGVVLIKKKKNLFIIGAVLGLIVIILVLFLVLFNESKGVVTLDNISSCEVSFKYVTTWNRDMWYDIELDEELKDELLTELESKRLFKSDEDASTIMYELRICEDEIKFGHKNDIAYYNDSKIKLGDEYNYLIDYVKKAMKEDIPVYMFKNEEREENDALEYIELTDRQKDKIVSYWKETDLSPTSIDLALYGEYILAINGDVLMFDENISYASYEGELIVLSYEFSTFLSDVINIWRNGYGEEWVSACSLCDPESADYEECLAECCSCKK